MHVSTLLQSQGKIGTIPFYEAIVFYINTKAHITRPLHHTLTILQPPSTQLEPHLDKNLLLRDMTLSRLDKLPGAIILKTTLSSVQ